MKPSKLLTLAVTIAFVGMGGAYAGWTSVYSLDHLTELYSFDVQTSVTSNRSEYNLMDAILEKGDKVMIRVASDGTALINLTNIGTLPAFLESAKLERIGAEGISETYTGSLICDGISLLKFTHSQDNQKVNFSHSLRIEPINTENSGPVDYGRHTVSGSAKLQLVTDVNTACLEASLSSLYCKEKNIRADIQRIRTILNQLKGGTCKVQEVPEVVNSSKAKTKPIDPITWWTLYYESQLSCLEAQLSSTQSSISSMESTLEKIRQSYWEITFYFDQYR